MVFGFGPARSSFVFCIASPTQSRWTPAITVSAMTSTFTVVLRGYDRDQVDRLLDEVDAALASSDEALQASARELLRSPDLTVVLRGYARDEVENAVKDRLNRLGSTVSDWAPDIPRAPSMFVVTLRGYDMAQVDEVFARADAALQSDSAFARASARDSLRAADFVVRLRGYARADVDRAVREQLQRLA